jgi:MFS family permease
LSQHLREHASPVCRDASTTAVAPAGSVPASADEPSPGTGVVATIFRLYPALTSPPFRLLWFSSIPSTMAWQLCVIATGYAALTLSGSATELGIVTSLGGLPMLVLAPIGGVVADRLPRRTVMFFTQATLGAGALALAVLSALDVLRVWHLGAVAFTQGIAFSFNMPARQALAMDLAGTRLARSAAALNTTAANFSRVVGPSVAGLLLSVPAVGVSGVFFTMMLMYGLVMATLTRIPRSVVPSRAHGPTGLAAVWGPLLEGIRYCSGSPLHRSLLATALVVVAFAMPVLQIMPVFSERIFEVGPVGLGLMLAANGVGALVGSIGVAALTGVPRLGLIQVGFGVLLGASIVGFALAPSFLVAVALLVLFGAFQASYMSLNGTLLLGNTEPRLYGRVLSLYLMTFAVSPICALPLAWASDRIGARPATAAVGLLVMVAVSTLTLLSPAARHAS